MHKLTNNKNHLQETISSIKESFELHTKVNNYCNEVIIDAVQKFLKLCDQCSEKSECRTVQ